MPTPDVSLNTIRAAAIQLGYLAPVSLNPGAVPADVLSSVRQAYSVVLNGGIPGSDHASCAAALASLGITLGYTAKTWAGVSTTGWTWNGASTFGWTWNGV